MSILLRTMTIDDAEQGYALTQQLKWSQRREDWLQAIELGEGIVAEEDGQYVGNAIGWRWGENKATIGLVIVNDKYQCRGIGKQLMLALLQKFEGYDIRLHATDMGKGLYEKLGFVVSGRILQHQTRALDNEPTVIIPSGLKLRDATVNDTDVLVKLDQQANGTYRPYLMKALIAGSKTVVLQDAQSRIQGFASLRRYGHGWGIGPVIAKTIQDAQCLISSLMQGLKGEFIRMDINAVQPLSAWLEMIGLPEVDAPEAMALGTPWPPQDGDIQAFGLMTQAMA